MSGDAAQPDLFVEVLTPLLGAFHLPLSCWPALGGWISK